MKEGRPRGGRRLGEPPLSTHPDGGGFVDLLIAKAGLRCARGECSALHRQMRDE